MMSVDGTPSRLGYASKNQNCSVKCPAPSDKNHKGLKDWETERVLWLWGTFSLPGLRTQPHSGDDNIYRSKIKLTKWKMIKSLRLLVWSFLYYLRLPFAIYLPSSTNWCFSKYVQGWLINRSYWVRLWPLAGPGLDKHNPVQVAPLSYFSSYW